MLLNIDSMLRGVSLEVGSGRGVSLGVGSGRGFSVSIGCCAVVSMATTGVSGVLGSDCWP